MDGQLVYVLIAGLILIVNALGMLWLQSIKNDVKELRQNYLNAIQSVARLEVEVANLKCIITELKAEIVILKSELAKAR